MKNFCFRFYFLIILLFHIINSLIVLPFKINGYNPKQKDKYNVTDLINEYLQLDIFTTIEIGSPPQKVTTLISTEENTFSLSSEICEKKSLNYISDYSIVSKNGLNLNRLKSYNNEFYNSNFNNYQNEEKNIGTLSETIYLYNTTFLSCQPLEWANKNGPKDTKIRINNFTMIIKDYKNDEKLCGRLGIGSPTLTTGRLLQLRGMTSFLDFLKKNNIINNYSWTIKLHHKEEGRLIIGGLPHEYENNNNKYNEKNFRTINSFWPTDVDFPWSIKFDSINFINSKNETIIIQEGLRSILAPNLGFIIGEEAYKNLILDNYFQDLINKKICILEKTSITKFTRTHYKFGTNGIYEIFHCNKSITNEQKFPKINFVFKEQSLIFSLNFYDLFQLMEERYFFLVIFPENSNNVKHSFWYLGLPFYKAYQFIFNFDSKTIGFYEQQQKINEEVIKEDNNIEDNNEMKSFRYKRTLLEIIFGVILVLIAYFIGKKINEQRKKRANELIDDYEYYSNTKKDNKDINNSNNSQKNKGNFEMSTSIGI